eukprot:scaffold1819_cov160-Amphora_coffeaeformis.AAC.1
MGRSKPTPVRQVASTAVLGRQTLAATEEERREKVQAAWIQQQLLDDGSPLDDDSDDEIIFEITEQSSLEEQGSKSPPRRMKRRVIKDSSSEDEESEGPKQATRVRSTSTPQSTRLGSKRKVSRKVSFQFEDKRVGDSPTLDVPKQKSPPKRVRYSTVPPKEKADTCVFQPHPNDKVWRLLAKTNTNGDNMMTLSYKASVDQPWEGGPLYRVYSHPSPFSHIQPEEGEDANRKWPPRIHVSSPTIINEILMFLFDEDLVSSEVIARCCQDACVVLLLERSQGHTGCWNVSIAITDRALEASSPQTLPFPRRKSKKYDTANAIHLLLGACYPSSVLADTSNSVLTDLPRGKDHKQQEKGSSSLPQVISARRVYECTDNQQLQQVLGTDLAELQKPIPGLVPTLRGYQKAAVAWMHRREQGQRKPKGNFLYQNEEWHLAWFVLNGLGVSPLMEYDLTRFKNQDDPVLLFCPFAGWMANSLAAARVMMIPDDTLSDVKGGILAESMGLGKSVEVLACILGNPRPPPPPFARRRLDFSSDSQSEGSFEGKVEAKNRKIDSDEEVGVGVVGDLSEFGDEQESDEDTIELSLKPEESARQTTEDEKQHITTSPSTPCRHRNKPIPITPDKETPNAIVRWVEDDEPLGSCICGNLIHLVDLASPVILCPNCDEPFHMECAGFGDTKSLEGDSEPLEYRLMFSDDKWQCRLGKSDNFCPCCLSSREKRFESRATLIVTPPAILGQWEREISRHVNAENFSVAVYDGVEKICKLYGPRKDGHGAKMKYLHPSLLANNDIVLMTFDVLMSDLGHSDENKFISGESNTNLRKRKRYRVVPSPLTIINWWRVCLDEAQRVEGTVSRAAKMALKLESEHRWLITGTPVGKGKLEDLYGLFLFLRLDPFSCRPFFNCCLSPSHRHVDSRIRRLLKDVFWRSTKKSETVCEQIGIPEQIEKKVLLRFSSIEKHFYERQLQETLLTAGDVADRAKSGKKHKSKQLNLLAEHLHSLRAACCHPQVGSSGIGKTRKGAKVKRKEDDNGNYGVGSRVMTMEEILIRFIEDAKLKCEEAQRLAVLHTNAMASVCRLKVEAKQRGLSFEETDERLLVRSCKLYTESLELGQTNAKPSRVLDRFVVSGSTGFLRPLATIEGGQGNLEWKIQALSSDHLWSRIDFEGPSRRLTRIQVRAIQDVPEYVSSETSGEIKWALLSPRRCVFQVSSAAVGGEFVDVSEIIFDQTEVNTSTWFTSEEFHTQKSKSWRIVVKDYNDPAPFTEIQNARYYLGLEIQLNEPEIAFDPLQRLHCLHNAGLAFTSLLQNQNSKSSTCSAKSSGDSFLSKNQMEQKIEHMKRDAATIENLYMEVVRSLHVECAKRLKESSSAREKLEYDLCRLKGKKLKDCFEDCWWDDFLSIVHLHGAESHQQQLYGRVHEDLDSLQGGPERGLVRFPPFRDVHGLRVALQSRMGQIRRGIGKPTSWIGTVDKGTTTYQFREDRFTCPVGGFAKCVDEICSLSPLPSDHDVYENSHCRVCKADWNQQGPQCKHCHIGDKLNELEADRVTVLVLNSIHNALKSPIGRSLLSVSYDAPAIEARAAKFFEVLEAHRKEKINAWRMWRIHLDLMNFLDELNQCKASMRLTAEGEDLSDLTDDQLNAVVIPQDLSPRFHDHAAKQAMAHGDLRRAKDTMRFLRNQTSERSDKNGTNDPTEEESCMVCLCAFEEGNRAVLRCGHSFHQTPCIDKLLQSGTREVRCPCRCRTRTRIDEVMIASNHRRDDGSRSKREVDGSWGTKVSRLIADLMDLRDTGEKGIVFSQWEDMLDIVETGLSKNGVRHVRARSLAKIGKSIDTFRLPDCTVLLLNVRNGAEGLTLVEANHVFMLEPLLSHALDVQAINRIHRIGQTSKTYVHRYIMQDSVEVKIDALRMEHQEDIIEDALVEAKTSELRAGGIDGGFHSEAELMDLLKMGVDQ